MELQEFTRQITRNLNHLFKEKALDKYGYTVSSILTSGETSVRECISITINGQSDGTYEKWHWLPSQRRVSLMVIDGYEDFLMVSCGLTDEMLTVVDVPDDTKHYFPSPRQSLVDEIAESMFNYFFTGIFYGGK